MEERTLRTTKEKLEKELSVILDKQNLNINDLEAMTKIVCALEKIEKIEKMEREEQDYNYSGRYHYPYSYDEENRRIYNDGRDTHSYERGRSARTGRYVSRDDGRMMPHYSGHSLRDRMIDKLESMYDEAATEHERKTLDKWIQKIEYDN